MNKVLHSSERMDWETPQAFFDMLDAEFHFGLDAAASKHNAKCKHYHTAAINGLHHGWGGYGTVWLNPPYGREIGKWIKRAYTQSQHQDMCYPVVCLIPARTDTTYWHDYVMRAGEIRFIKGRLHFVGGKYPAPFPSAIVIFCKTKRRSPKISTLELVKSCLR